MGQDTNELLKKYIDEYISAVSGRVSSKTIKAYRCDLYQFLGGMQRRKFDNINEVNSYISVAYAGLKKITVKRKIASLKAFYRYLSQCEAKFSGFAEELEKCTYQFKPEYNSATILELEAFYKKCYSQYAEAESDHQIFCTLRNIVITQLLFSTGITVTELCECKIDQINVEDKVIVFGKDSSKRELTLNNGFDMDMLAKYLQNYRDKIDCCGYVFFNNRLNQIQEQSVRRIMSQVSKEAGLKRKMTPSMFRNAFIDLSIKMGTDKEVLKNVLGKNSYEVIENHIDKMNHMNDGKIIYQSPLALLK